MSTDEVTGPVAVRLRCDMNAEGQFVIELEENTVCPKCDMEAVQTNDKVVENNAVRPKSDIDAGEMTDNKIEKNEIRRESDMDAQTFDQVAENRHENENGAAAAKRNLKPMMMSS